MSKKEENAADEAAVQQESAAPKKRGRGRPRKYPKPGELGLPPALQPKEKPAPIDLSDLPPFPKDYAPERPDGAMLPSEILAGIKPDPAHFPHTRPAYLPDKERIVAYRKTKALLDSFIIKEKLPLEGRNLPLTVKLRSLLRNALENATNRISGKQTDAASDDFRLVPTNPVRVLLGVSGGRDSMALLDVAAKQFQDKSQALIGRLAAAYVHHGLSSNADSWSKHVKSECAKRKVPFVELRVNVSHNGEGIEASAREERYKALTEYAQKEGYDVVCTAHHQDDRVETFIIQWLRGAGPEGLSAFPECRSLLTPGSLPKLGLSPNHKDVVLVRPWLSATRSEIDLYVRNHKIKFVEDESNEDTNYLRNRVRHDVVPFLEGVRPGFTHAAARTVELISEATDVIRSIAHEDIEACRSDELPCALKLYKFLSLIPARQSWCLRTWMMQEGMRLPSKARIDDALRQIRESHYDTNFSLTQGGLTLRRWGEHLVIRPTAKKRGENREEGILFQEDEIPLPAWNGVVKVEKCADGELGIPLERLKSEFAILEVRERRGGEKMQLWPNRPSKHLKDLFQPAGIPQYQRDDLPLLWLNGELIFVAGLGIDCRHAVSEGPRVKFSFHPEASLWGDNPVPNFGELPDHERRLIEDRYRERSALENTKRRMSELRKLEERGLKRRP